MEQRPLVEDIQNYAQNIVDTVREPLLILDAMLRVRSANRAFYQTFHVTPGETEGRLIYELGNGQWDIPDLRTLLEDIVPKSSVFEDFELEHTFPAIGRRVMLLNARKLQAGQHGELLVLAMGDVTECKRAEEALLKAGALQSAIFNSANFSSIATDEKGVIQIFNVGAERMLGYMAAEVMNKITPADISDPQEVITRAKALSAELGTKITPGFEALVFKAARGIEDIYELTYIRKDGSRFPAVVSVTALRDDQSAIIGYLLIGTDNTAQASRRSTTQGRRLAERHFQQRQLLEHCHGRQGCHPDLQRGRRAHAGLRGRRSDQQDHPGGHFRSTGSHHARQGPERRARDHDHAGLRGTRFQGLPWNRRHLRVDLHPQGWQPLSGHRLGDGAPRRTRGNYRLPLNRYR